MLTHNISRQKAKVELNCLPEKGGREGGREGETNTQLLTFDLQEHDWMDSVVLVASRGLGLERTLTTSMPACWAIILSTMPVFLSLTVVKSSLAARPAIAEGARFFLAAHTDTKNCRISQVNDNKVYSVSGSNLLQYTKPQAHMHVLKSSRSGHSHLVPPLASISYPCTWPFLLGYCRCLFSAHRQPLLRFTHTHTHTHTSLYTTEHFTHVVYGTNSCDVEYGSCLQSL